MKNIKPNGGNMTPDENDVLSEIKTDEPLDFPTEMELFWESILTAKEALEDALSLLMLHEGCAYDAEEHLANSAISDRPGEIRVNTDHFMNLSGGVRNAMLDIKEVEGERRI